jgi:DNA topoisomerase I
VVLLPPQEIAADAGLRYTSDLQPGIRRKRSGRGFSYLDREGRPVRDRKQLARFHSLVIPPAWRDVWISPYANGHLQATGRDARGRKQYRYHPKWREIRDATKYGRMIAFGERLADLRDRIQADLAKGGLSRERILAAIVRILDETLIRVGNEEYARQNNSFGLTTLRSDHVGVEGAEVRFHFRGKSGKDQELALKDRRIAGVVRRCQELPGHELFQYLEDGETRTVGSADVNDYLRDAMGEEFTSKDFRTWGASVLALDALLSIGPGASESAIKKNLVSAVKMASEQLHNTPAVCRSSYIHPAIFEYYQSGNLADLAENGGGAPSGDSRLTEQEQALLRFLRRASSS